MSQLIAPDLLPVLSRGGHRAPEHGACLMEYVSQLAGCRFCDRPPCTDPALSAIARHVNDSTSDSNRSRLLLLAPELASIPSVSPREVVAIAVYCTEQALRQQPDDFVRRRAARRAGRRARWLRSHPEAGNVRLRIGNARTGMAVLITAATSRIVLDAAEAPDGDHRLFDLLAGCLRARETQPGCAIQRCDALRTANPPVPRGHEPVASI